ncbi:MAG: hypothetical protein ABI361_13970 [Nitrososphaera sp.]|jgi:hypothetical protein
MTPASWPEGVELERSIAIAEKTHLYEMAIGAYCDMVLLVLLYASDASASGTAGACAAEEARHKFAWDAARADNQDVVGKLNSGAEAIGEKLAHPD